MEEEKVSGAYKTKDKEEYAHAARVTKEFEHVSSISGLENYEANKLLADTQGNFVNIVELSHYYADKIGLIKSAIKVYVTLTTGDILLEGGEEANKTVLRKFIKDTQLDKTLRQSIPDLYKAGNFFWYREIENGKTVWVHQFNPVDVNVKGHKRDRPVATFQSSNDPETLPVDFEKSKFGEYKLPIEQTYHCALDREGYLRYGKPITTATFEPIQHIQELVDMEKQSISSVIENLIIITLGDEKRPATQEQIEKLKEHVEKLHSSSRLVGNHTLKADVIEKDVGVFNPEKFKVPMDMLLQSIGVVSSVVTGDSSYASATAGMSTTKKTIETNRLEIESVLDQLFKDIAEENGLDADDNPEISLGKLNLSEERTQHTIIRNLFLDGVISAETYAMVHGHDLDIEQEKLDIEKELYEIEPRAMSSTLSGSDGRPLEGDNSEGENNPNGDAKPSTN